MQSHKRMEQNMRAKCNVSDHLQMFFFFEHLKYNDYYEITGYEIMNKSLIIEANHFTESSNFGVCALLC